MREQLEPQERAIWDECAATGTDVLDAWSFGFLCMLELGYVPEVVADYLAAHDPEDRIKCYWEARRGRSR